MISKDTNCPNFFINSWLLWSSATSVATTWRIDLGSVYQRGGKDRTLTRTCWSLVVQLLEQMSSPHFRLSCSGNRTWLLRCWNCSSLAAFCWTWRASQAGFWCNPQGLGSSLFLVDADARCWRKTAWRLLIIRPFCTSVSPGTSCKMHRCTSPDWSKAGRIEVGC